MTDATETMLTTDDGPMGVIEAVPDRRARGGVVVVQDAFGVTPYLADVCRRLAAEGWHAVAPALYHRTATTAVAYDQVDEAVALLGTLDAGAIETDIAACLDHLALAGHGSGRCGVVGFCMGGSVVTHACAWRALGAGIAFYGGGVLEGRMGIDPLVDVVGRLRTPWLGLYGEADPSIPVDHLDALQSALKAAPVDAELVRYPGAQHAFHCDARPQVFDPAAAADAWRRTLAHLDTHIGGAP